MMKEYANSRKTILEGKLSKLLEQLNSLLHDEFPIGDSHKAITVLLAKAERIAENVKKFENYSPQIREALSKQVKYILAYSSHILGILARSSTTRNAFELYEPFKEMSQSFFDSEIFIIMSSEWSYVPFTYPMNIQELPDFIIIGLPATESSNVLVFPSAAHEMGHSIWLKRDLSEKYSEKIASTVEQKIASDDKIIRPFMLGISDNDDKQPFCAPHKTAVHY